MVALLGVSVAEHSGLLSAAMRGMVMGALSLVTFMVVFAAILSNTASELGYVVLIPLAAMIFHSLEDILWPVLPPRLLVFLVVTVRTYYWVL